MDDQSIAAVNVLSTIPKGKYPYRGDLDMWLKRADGSDKFRFWLVNCQQRPTKTAIGNFCYMVYNGEVIGYFSIVDIKPTEECRSFHNIGKPRNTISLVLADWHPITPVGQKGFQGYRYTHLSPLT